MNAEQNHGDWERDGRGEGGNCGKRDRDRGREKRKRDRFQDPKKLLEPLN